MKQTIAPARLDWRPLHAVVFLVLFLGTMRTPIAAYWPWYVAIPALVYACLCGMIPALRRSCAWIVLGKWDGLALSATPLIIALSSLALVLYQWIMVPDVRELAGRLPARVLGSVVLAGMLFAVVNAILEELLFRGVLYDGVEWRWGWKTAVMVTAAIFGIFHVHGYPPGAFGAVMAATYGLLLGWLRHRTQGLSLPILAHVFADATIFGILVHVGVP